MHTFLKNTIFLFFQSLDVPLASEVPSPPLDCDIVLPPPAESLYSLPRSKPTVYSTTFNTNMRNSDVCCRENMLKHLSFTGQPLID